MYVLCKTKKCRISSHFQRSNILSPLLPLSYAKQFWGNYTFTKRHLTMSARPVIFSTIFHSVFVLFLTISAKKEWRPPWGRRHSTRQIIDLNQWLQNNFWKVVLRLCWNFQLITSGYGSTCRHNRPECRWPWLHSR